MAEDGEECELDTDKEFCMVHVGTPEAEIRGTACRRVS